MKGFIKHQARGASSANLPTYLGWARALRRPDQPVYRRRHRTPGDYTESLAIGHHRILVTGTETGGSLGIWEEIVEPGWARRCTSTMQRTRCSTCSRGCIRIWCGEETFEAVPGTTAVLPRGIPHRFENVGEITARTWGRSLPAC